MSSKATWFYSNSSCAATINASIAQYAVSFATTLKVRTSCRKRMSAHMNISRQFEGRAQFSTWLTRIAVNEALKRVAARGKLDPLDEEQYEREEGTMPAFQSNSPDSGSHRIEQRTERACLKRQYCASALRIARSSSCAMSKR